MLYRELQRLLPQTMQVQITNLPVKQADSHAVLYQSQDPSDTVFILLQGTVLLLEQTHLKIQNDIAGLPRKYSGWTAQERMTGCLVGQSEFLRKANRKSTAICLTACRFKMVSDKQACQRLAVAGLKIATPMIQTLQEMTLFRDWPLLKLYRLVASSLKVHPQPARKLYCRGDPADSLYVLLEGELRIGQTAKDISQSRYIGQVLPGQFVGEDGLTLHPFKRKYSIAISSNSKMLRLSRQPLLGWLITQGSIQELNRVAAKRQRHCEQAYAQKKEVSSQSEEQQKSRLVSSPGRWRQFQLKPVQLKHSVYHIATHRLEHDKEIKIKLMEREFQRAHQITSLRSFKPKHTIAQETRKIESAHRNNRALFSKSLPRGSRAQPRAVSTLSTHNWYQGSRPFTSLSKREKKKREGQQFELGVASRPERLWQMNLILRRTSSGSRSQLKLARKEEWSTGGSQQRSRKLI